MSNLWRLCKHFSKFWADILFKYQWYVETVLIDTRLGPGLSSASPLNEIKGLKNQAGSHIVIIATRKDNA